MNWVNLSFSAHIIDLFLGHDEPNVIYEVSNLDYDYLCKIKSSPFSAITVWTELEKRVVRHIGTLFPHIVSLAIEQRSSLSIQM